MAAPDPKNRGCAYSTPRRRAGRLPCVLPWPALPPPGSIRRKSSRVTWWPWERGCAGPRGIATRTPRCFGCTDREGIDRQTHWALVVGSGAGGLLTAPRSRGYFCPRIRSAARSAMAMVAAFTIACGNDGITDASTTRRPWVPRTRNARSTTAFSSVPIRQVPTG
jgi:hypothetical protein